MNEFICENCERSFQQKGYKCKHGREHCNEKLKRHLE